MRAETGQRRPTLPVAMERMRVTRKAQAAQFAANVLPIIRDIQAAGFTSLNAIAGQLNARKVATANGGQWDICRCGTYWIERLRMRDWPPVPGWTPSFGGTMMPQP
jgi:hypothetical protein